MTPLLISSIYVVLVLWLLPASLNLTLQRQRVVILARKVEEEVNMVEEVEEEAKMAEKVEEEVEEEIKMAVEVEEEVKMAEKVEEAVEVERAGEEVEQIGKDLRSLTRKPVSKTQCFT